ncbi:hypothetical protein SNE40_018325 [Patella caerulea]|uniref:Reverse transcriptase domain-containing protein n=1 Tax=Patella caerulea TaxID=87958 RepID=A0AAN8J7E8_PATCE
MRSCSNIQFWRSTIWIIKQWQQWLVISYNFKFGTNNKHDKVFHGLDKHKLYKASFIVDKTVKPVIQKQRKVPYNLEDKALAEEIRLINNNIIEDVPSTEPITWYTIPVTACKPHNKDAIRYCTNMRPANIAIKRPIVEVPTVEDIAVKLNGARVFSKLDMNESYHQIEMDEKSRHLTTFYGVYGKKNIQTPQLRFHFITRYFR